MHRYCPSSSNKAADSHLQVVRLWPRHHGGLDAVRVYDAEAPVPANAAPVAGLVGDTPPDAHREPAKVSACFKLLNAEHDLAVQENECWQTVPYMPNTLDLPDVHVSISAVKSTCTSQRHTHAASSTEQHVSTAVHGSGLVVQECLAPKSLKTAAPQGALLLSGCQQPRISSLPLHPPGAQQSIRGHEERPTAAAILSSAPIHISTVLIHPATSTAGGRASRMPSEPMQEAVSSSNTATPAGRTGPSAMLWCGVLWCAVDTDARHELRCTYTSTSRAEPQPHLFCVSFPLLPNRPFGGLGGLPPPWHPDCNAHKTQHKTHGMHGCALHRLSQAQHCSGLTPRVLGSLTSAPFWPHNTSYCSRQNGMTGCAPL
jgi:hypothetical protein